MNAIASWAAKNQKLLAGGGAVAGVTGVALVHRHQTNKGAASSTRAASQAVAPATADTTATDLYNALQPQIEQVLDAVRASNPGDSWGAQPPADVLSPIDSQTPSSGATSPTPTVAQPAARIATPVVADSLPANVLGAGFVNSYEGTSATWAPITSASSPVQAPAGSRLVGGVWKGDQLISGHYVNADGSRTTVGSAKV